MRKKIFRTLALLLLCGGNLSAQVNQAAFTSLLKDFESPKLYVNAIVQDKQGFIWFGTYKGLIRFDGISYIRYRPVAGNIHSVSDNEVNALFKDSRGNLWIGTRNGLNRYDYLTNSFQQFFHHPEDKNSLCNNEVFAIAEDRFGRLWVGTLNGGISIIDRVVEDKDTVFRFSNYAHDAGNPSSLSGNTVNTICFDQAGNGFIGTNFGLNVVPFNQAADRPVTFQHYYFDAANPTGIASNNVYRITCDKKNNILLNAQFGMIDLLPASSIASGQFDFIHLLPVINAATHGTLKSASMLLIDSRGNYWLSTYENGLYRFSLTKEGHITGLCNFRHHPLIARSLADGGVSAIFESADHSIWVGTDAGASKWNPLQEQFSEMELPANFPLYLTSSAIAQDKDGTFWFGSSENDTLYAVTSSSALYKLVLAQKTTNVKRKVYTTSLLAASNGDLLAGTSVGVFIIPFAEKEAFLKKINYRPQFAMLQQNKDTGSLVSNLISCLDEDDMGNIWIGSGMGLNKYEPETKKCERILWSKVPGEINPSYIVRDICAASGGSVWVGTDKGLFSVNARRGTYKQYDANNKLPGSRYLFIHESRQQGLLWLGTEQGLLSFDTLSHQFQNHPLPGNERSISAIEEDEKGNLWISTQSGLLRFHPATGDITTFTTENGLITNHFSDNVSCVAENGAFLFGTEKGIISFLPDSIPANTRIPPVLITDVRIYNQSVFDNDDLLQANDFLRTKKLSLRYNQNFFSIDFAALNYNNAAANNYAYQLEGIDQDWVAAGNRRTATYTNIGPGCYTFRVKGSNNDGVWNNEGASLQLIINPPWWKTWWFYSICAIAVLAALNGLYRYRINQIKKVFAIRSKIARDLHDDIGSTLSSISLMSQLAKDGGVTHEREEALFDTISSASREAMELMSVIVWSVNPNNDKLQNILIKMREYASDTLEASNIEVVIKHDDEVKDLIVPMEKRKDFYLIFKEAVNNAAKYSKATHVQISFTKEHGKIIMTIADNGQGFETAQLRSGNGLVNMEVRARSIGGLLNITSQKGNGTVIRLEMPVVT